VSRINPVAGETGERPYYGAGNYDCLWSLTDRRIKAP